MKMGKSKSKEIGKIEKPKVEGYREKRKLYIVPIPPSVEVEKEKLEGYWKDISEKIDYFREKFGEIKKIYSEGITSKDNWKDEVKRIAFGQNQWLELLDQLVKRGGEVEVIEDENLLRMQRGIVQEYSSFFSEEIKALHKEHYGEKSLKWEDFLMRKLTETDERIKKHASEIIERTLGDNDGILFKTDAREIPIPIGIESFNIRPPSLEDIYTSLRGKMRV
jgi:hypothetical protein